MARVARAAEGRNRAAAKEPRCRTRLRPARGAHATTHTYSAAPTCPAPPGAARSHTYALDTGPGLAGLAAWRRVRMASGCYGPAGPGRARGMMGFGADERTRRGGGVPKAPHSTTKTAGCGKLKSPTPHPARPNKI